MPIAITGMGCRFPGGADSPAAFWRLLRDGIDAITEIPPTRMDVAEFYDPRPATPGRMMTRWGGFLGDLESFDASFFQISPREAERMDPAQRLLLETSWEALEDAGMDARTLVGSPTGVFVGQWTSDYEGRVFADPAAVDFYLATGSGRYATAGRLSFAFGFQGPSLSIDSACSSSLAAVHLACQSLRSGESTLALAGGVNIILQPQITIAYSQSQMMAPDGRCKFADARGDGYVRSEGVGVIVIKTLARALADGDRIYALLRGSAVNNDGSSSGRLSRPSRSGQEQMLRLAYRHAGIDPTRVRYVEAHGTGTRAGDPIELGAIGAVLTPGRPAAHRLLVGSVKTNIGHTEGAAGIAGVIKTALSLHHGAIPASLHFQEPNPSVPWDELPCDIPTTLSPWPAGEGPRVAGVSAYGITGTNAHVVLEEAPVRPSSTEARPTSKLDETPPFSTPMHLLVLSAHDTRSLAALATAYADRLTGPSALSVADVCANAARHRTALEHRAAFVAPNAATLADALRRFADGDHTAVAASGHVLHGATRRLAFVFPGQGSQWVGMARELLSVSPAFRHAIGCAEKALQPFVDWSVVEQLHADPESAAFRLDDIAVIQPVLLAIELALAALWRSIGVRPDAVIGHSMGEIAAAHVAGALSLDDAMRVVAHRSALMRRTSGRGAMALVELSADDAA
ncbi:MAG TPA: type I polyketide synthase, partial [Gemmatimonadaceae bacterium]